MSLRNFDEYEPSERFDGNPWIGVKILEAEESDGPYAEIDDIPSSEWTPTGQDADPAHPRARSFTTSAAALDEGWYVARFYDAVGGNTDSEPRRYPYDPLDIRLMVPRVRRALNPLGLDGDLNDDQVKDIVADACASIMLSTGSLFGHELSVTARDARGAPDEYRVSEELTLSEQTVIAAQAALDYFGMRWATSKTSERIADEGSTWEWTISPQLLIAQLKQLRTTRDEAIASLDDQGSVARYTSFIAVHDLALSRSIEPWATGGGGGGLDGDVRFGTVV